MFSKILNIVRNIILFKIIYPWVKVGVNVHCQFSTRFLSPKRNVKLGDNVGIGFNCFFLTNVSIGNKVLIASNVSFISKDDHNFNIIGKTIWDSGRGDKFNIIVEDDVWIGQGATIISPCKIGRGSVIAAGSIISNLIEPYSIYAGVPGKLIKKRFSDIEIYNHESILIQKKELQENKRTIKSI